VLQRPSPTFLYLLYFGFIGFIIIKREVEREKEDGNRRERGESGLE
jgi:hypothetical protein